MSRPKLVPRGRGLRRVLQAEAEALRVGFAPLRTSDVVSGETFP